MFKAAIFNVTRAAHVVAYTAVLTSAMVAVLLIAAQAKPSPYEPPRASLTPDLAAIASAASVADDEHAYFQAPPSSANHADRCTVRAVVFAKISLVKACY